MLLDYDPSGGYRLLQDGYRPTKPATQADLDAEKLHGLLTTEPQTEKYLGEAAGLDRNRVQRALGMLEGVNRAKVTRPEKASWKNPNTWVLA